LVRVPRVKKTTQTFGLVVIQRFQIVPADRAQLLDFGFDGRNFRNKLMPRLLLQVGGLDFRQSLRHKFTL
jgi:hypothetical protein